MTKRWMCAVCGQIFEGERPPLPCPVCGAGEDAFVLMSETGVSFRRDSVERFVIVGGGGAALEAAKALRARNQLCGIQMICAENLIPYNRPALSDVVGDGFGFEAIALKPFEYYALHRIELISGARAESVNAVNKTVSLSDGRALEYDKLLLATGANSFNPIKRAQDSIPMGCLRTFADALNVIEQCSHRRVLIVGGGILGLEAALALRERGAQVKVAELGERILALQADVEGSGRLQAALESLGIQILTGRTVASLTPSGAILTDGQPLEADFVLVSIGVRSEVSLARDMGLAVNRGILVDELMRTSVPDVYAAGDCAEFAGRVAGLWGAACAQGRAAGAAMAGDLDGALYAPPVPATALEMPGFRMFTAGTLSGDRLVSYTRQEPLAHSLRRVYCLDGHVCGAAFYGDVHASAAALSAIACGAPASEAAALLE